MLRNEVFDFDFKRYGIVEQFTFCQYEARFYEPGIFTIKCPITDENVSMLKKNRIIWLDKDIAGIIERINITTFIEVNGSTLENILSWRYIYPAFSKTENPAEMMYDVVDQNCVSCDNEKRNFPMLEIVREHFELENISKQQTGGSIIDFLTEFGGANEIGYRIGFYPKEKKFKFFVRKGSDRSVGNNEGNKRVVFSEALNNIINADYTYNSDGFRNVALVAGEENGNVRTVKDVYVGDEPSGVERKELYVDARDLQSEFFDESGRENKVSPEEYMNMLDNRGREKLNECNEIESVEADLRNDASTIFRFGIDYNIGDKVTIVKESLNIAANTIVTGVTVTQDEKSYTETPSFGKTEPRLYDVLKKKGVVV